MTSEMLFPRIRIFIGRNILSIGYFSSLTIATVYIPCKLSVNGIVDEERYVCFNDGNLMYYSIDR